MRFEQAEPPVPRNKQIRAIYGYRRERRCFPNPSSFARLTPTTVTVDMIRSHKLHQSMASLPRAARFSHVDGRSSTCNAQKAT